MLASACVCSASPVDAQERHAQSVFSYYFSVVIIASVVYYVMAVRYPAEKSGTVYKKATRKLHDGVYGDVSSTEAREFPL